MTKIESKTNKALKNVSVAFIMQIIAILLAFVSRTIFVRLLGNDYLSADGLFSNILTVLSFTELGIGSAIIFNLYGPIVKKDKIMISKLMNLFRSSYRIISFVILLLGVAFIPFLKYIISDVPDIKESLTILYLLFLLNTVSSYVFGYKKSFLIANQENYIVSLVTEGIVLFRITLQIILLLITKNYMLYLIIAIICTLLSNIVTTYITNKKYPWIDDNKNLRLTNEEKRPIFINISNIFLYKLGAVILGGTDNIIISTILDTSLVGIVSNYNLIINSVTAVLNQVFNALQPSVGSHNSSSTKDEKFHVFEKLYFISFLVVGLCSVLLAILLTPFVSDLWLGKEYELEWVVVISLSLSFYVSFINVVPSTYRTTLGYFKEARFSPFIASILNVVLSIALGKMIGLSGIFFATSISRLLTFNVIDPYFVYKKGFKKQISKYFSTFSLYTIIVIGIYSFSLLVTNLIGYTGILGFLLKGLTTVLIYIGVVTIIFYSTNSFRDSITIFKRLIRRG